MASKLDYVSDWAARLRSRLYTQFRGKVTWEQWVVLLGKQFQDLEDAAQTILTLLSIDDSVGAQLDLIGRIVGQPRRGASDDTYRLYLRARIRADLSTGSPEDIYSVVRALVGAGLLYLPGFLKDFVLRITSVVTPAQAAVALEFLGDSEEAGARGILEWQEDADSAMFYTGLCGVLPSSAFATSTSFFVDGAYLFPAAPGQIKLNPGGSTEETVTYTAIFTSGDGFETSALANSHSAGEVVELVGDPGLGFGDASDSTVGGKLEGAAQA